MERLSISYINTKDIKPYKHNAKIHTPEQIEQIKYSITEFGFDDPIAIDECNTVIEGHGRLQAAQELGIEKVPTIMLKDLTDQQKKAYIIIHNQLTMNTGFDLDILNRQMEEINEYDMSRFGVEKIITTPEELKEMQFFDDFKNFSLTLSFSCDDEDLIKEYVRTLGKDYIVENVIMEVIRECHSVEVSV